MEIDDPLRHYLDSHEPELNDWLTAKDFCRLYPEVWPSRDALRRACRKADENGLHEYKCLRRIHHNLLLVNRVNVLKWIESGGNGVYVRKR